jgi:hypothetical protein
MSYDFLAHWCDVTSRGHITPIYFAIHMSIYVQDDSFSLLYNIDIYIDILSVTSALKCGTQRVFDVFALHRLLDVLDHFL